MAEYRSLSHTRWDCKYHVVFIPKRRKKAIYGHVRRMLGETLRELAAHKEAEIVERASAAGSRSHVLEGTSEMRVSNVVGCLKGKSAIMIARFFVGKERNFTGENFWARGYFVSTVGLDEATVIAYIRNREAEEERHEQLKMRMPF